MLEFLLFFGIFLSVASALFTIIYFSKTKYYYEKITEVSTQNTHYNYARSLIEASLDPFVTISPDGKITDVNDATIIATGVKREELIGTDFSTYFAEPEKAREGYQKVLSKGFVKGYELTLKHVNGSLIPVQYTASLYRNEMGQIQGVFAVARDVSELVNLKNKLQVMAMHDQLTQLPNRRFLYESGKRILSSAVRNKTNIAVAFIDINNFKPINDTYGHSVGDNLLIWFASHLSQLTRDSDIVARYGGDEFVILFNNGSDNKETYRSRIHDCIMEEFTFIQNGHEIAMKIAISIGIVFLSDVPNNDLHSLIHAADELMYQDKIDSKQGISD